MADPKDPPAEGSGTNPPQVPKKASEKPAKKATASKPAAKKAPAKAAKKAPRKAAPEPPVKPAPTPPPVVAVPAAPPSRDPVVRETPPPAPAGPNSRGIQVPLVIGLGAVVLAVMVIRRRRRD